LFDRIQNVFVRSITVAARKHGGWVVRWGAWWVALGYYLFRPARVKSGIDFYRTLYPGRSRWFHRRAVWRQFQEYSANVADGVLVGLGRPYRHRSEGFEHLRAALDSKTGGIIIISHLGNWEIGARLFGREGLPLTLMMGQQKADAANRLQKGGLRAEGVEVNVAEAGSTTAGAFDGIEALRTVRQGGLVAVSGDVAWTDPRRRVRVEFLGRPVDLPEAPHRLALISGAPIYTVFAWRLGRMNHQFVTLPPRWVTAESRDGRPEAIQASAQRFADELERVVRDHPWQWGVFEPFFASPAE
jgi:lauroyl/myristoyl acyltransferase